MGQTRKNGDTVHSGGVKEAGMESTDSLSLLCGTRLIKNARYLQRQHPELAVPDAAGITGVARDFLARGDIELPRAGSGAGQPLFHGTVHFVRVLFGIQGQDGGVARQVVLDPADMQTAVAYAALAALPIGNYASQYGENRLEVSSTVLDFNVLLPMDATYTDATLQSWVNTMVTEYHLPAADTDNSCVVLLNPPGVVNVDVKVSDQIGGYHAKADIPYAFVNVTGSSGFTVDDVLLQYAALLSHELAELVVDPSADYSNPEVCDPCDSTCQGQSYYYLNYFDASGNYLRTAQGWPPPAPYAFYIESIVAAAFTGQCPPSAPQACAYPPFRETFAHALDAAPAAAGRADNLFVLIKQPGQPQGQVLFNQAAPGAAFAGWQAVPGGLFTPEPLTTDAQVGAGMQDTTLFVFAKTPAPEGQIAFNQAAAGGAFVGWQLLPGITTDQAPAAAGRSDNLFVFVTDRQGNIQFNQAAPGGAFAGWQTLPGLTTDTAVGAGMQDTTLFVFAKETAGSVWFNQAPPGGAFENWQPLPGVTTDQAPAAAGRSDNLFVFVTDLSGTIWFNQAAPGGAFAGWQTLPGLTTDTAVGAGMQDTTLFVFAKTAGADGQIAYNQAAAGGAFVGWQDKSIQFG
jgi:hypothetical protein